MEKGCNVSPLRGEKPQYRPLSDLNTARFAAGNAAGNNSSAVAEIWATVWPQKILAETTWAEKWGLLCPFPWGSLVTI